MIRRRERYLYLGRICFGLLFLCFLSTTSFARQIALFYDPLYVDINDENVFAEASNLKASLESLGHEVLLFTDLGNIIGADFDVVIIPELEKAGLTQNLTSDQLNVYRNYIEAGGSIIIMGVVSSVEFQGNNAIDFINEMKGSQMQVGSPILEGTCTKNQNFPSGEYDSAPDEINNNNAVVYIQNNFPNDTNVLYYNEVNTSEAAVAEFEMGEGSLMYFGWGWWNASPYGSQDGGWLSLLDVTVEALSCNQPELILEDRYQFSLELNGKYSLRAEDFVDSYTACTDVELSFSQTDFNCEDVGRELQIEVILMDELEREVKQTITVDIVDLHGVCALIPLSYQLNGNIHAVNGKPLQDVAVTLEAEVPLYLTTDENGMLSAPLLESQAYSLTLHKEAALARHVTTNDLRLLQHHILGLNLFTSPYQFLAADLNGDRKLDIDDITLMRKIILNHDITDGAIPINWLWVDTDFIFDHGSESPLLEDWNTVQGSVLDLDNLQLQLIGIKIGDIDASYQD